MGRLLAIALWLYAFGHSQFDAWRPLAFDASLREFHRDINRIASETSRVFVVFDRTGTLHALGTLGSQLQAILTAR